MTAPKERPIKAITLWQPWATLIALGHKRVETRSWGTSYRGPIAIHAAKRPMGDDEQDLLDDVGLYYPQLDLVVVPGLYPLGCVVATAQLVHCQRMTPEMVEQASDLELELGDWRSGRYAWVLEDVEPLKPPIPARGAQGMWDWQAPA